MTTELSAQFDDPSTVASYIGESVGTHYSAALRATQAYGKYLAASRASLLSGEVKGDCLERFWKEMMDSEQVLSSSPSVIRALKANPAHYFADFLDTADAVFQRKYEDVSEQQRKKVGQTQHAQCLKILRDHEAAGMKDHFTVQNKVGTWMQMLRAMGAYQR